MLLLKKNAAPEVWTARADLDAAPHEVLDALTDSALIAAWAPVPFEVDGLAGGRLRAGSRERVSGSFAGVGATFEVEVTHADRRRLELVAHGPVTLDVAYTLREQEHGVAVEASVALRRPRGLAAQVLRAAVAAALSAGALSAALRRLEASLVPAAEPELIAA